MTTPRDPTQFTRDSAKRIARVVRAAELTPRPSKPLVFETVVPQKTDKVFRIAEFSGQWPWGVEKQIEFLPSSDPPTTALARNVICGINASGPCQINVGKSGDSWYLLSADMTKLPGFSEIGMHVLVVQNGYLEFVQTTEC